MNLKPELLATLVALGTTDDELVLLGGRMLGAVSGLQAQLNALDAQLQVLNAQRDAVNVELTQAQITVAKLMDLNQPEPSGA